MSQLASKESVFRQTYHSTIEIDGEPTKLRCGILLIHDSDRISTSSHPHACKKRLRAIIYFKIIFKIFLVGIETRTMIIESFKINATSYSGMKNFQEPVAARARSCSISLHDQMDFFFTAKMVVRFVEILPRY